MNRTLAAALALFAATVLLGAWIAWAGTPPIDPWVANAASSERQRAWLWLAATRAGDWEARVAIGLGGAAWLWFRHRQAAALVLIGITLVQTLTNSALKLVFARARPDLFAHLDAVWDLSFPSGHAAQTATVYLLAAWLVDRRLLLIAVPLTTLVGTSRIVLGVHWPTDVLAGWMEGAGFALLGVYLSRRTKEVRASTSLGMDG